MLALCNGVSPLPFRLSLFFSWPADNGQPVPPPAAAGGAGVLKLPDCRARVLEGVVVVVVVVAVAAVDVVGVVAAAALRLRPPAVPVLGGSAWFTRPNGVPDCHHYQFVEFANMLGESRKKGKRKKHNIR